MLQHDLEFFPSVKLHKDNVDYKMWWVEIVKLPFLGELSLYVYPNFKSLRLILWKEFTKYDA